MCDGRLQRAEDMHTDVKFDDDASSHVCEVSEKNRRETRMVICSKKNTERADADAHAREWSSGDVYVFQCVACAGKQLGNCR